MAYSISICTLGTFGEKFRQELESICARRDLQACSPTATERTTFFGFGVTLFVPAPLMAYPKETVGLPSKGME